MDYREEPSVGVTASGERIYTSTDVYWSYGVAENAEESRYAASSVNSCPAVTIVEWQSNHCGLFVDDGVFIRPATPP